MPGGTFILKDHGSRPLIMISAGIGVTPIMSMIDSLANSYNEKDTQTIVCIAIERSPEEHAMKDHIDKLVGKGMLTESHVFYTRHSGETTNLCNTHVHIGRPTVDSFSKIVSKQLLTEAEFYFCGPEMFMNDFKEILDTLKVEKNQRHTGRFGPEI